jgi:hypothetical protein
MSEHTETHRVSAEGDLPAVMDTLMAAFGREAVKAAWLEASGDGDEVDRLRDGIRVHKAATDDCGDGDCGCVTSSDRQLWSLLDGGDTDE